MISWIATQSIEAITIPYDFWKFNFFELYDLYTIKLTLLKYTIQQLLVYLICYRVASTFPVQATTRVLFLSLDLLGA
jgi:hypothetical protein